MLSAESETTISAVTFPKDYDVDRTAAGFGDEYNSCYQSSSPVIGHGRVPVQRTRRSGVKRYPPHPPPPWAYDQISLSLIIAVTVAFGRPFV